MTECANKTLLRGLPEVFASGKGADCDVIFCRDESAPTRSAQPSLGAASCVQGGPEGADTSLATADGPKSSTVFGEPLPAHCLVLSLTSKRLLAEIERCYARSLSQSASSAAASACGRPQLRIPLGSVAEVPAARAALRFAYTGEVPAGSSVREVLELRRQGVYLQISGCAEACDGALEAKLKGVCGATAASSNQEAGGSNKRARTSEEASQSSAVLELFGCVALWPDPSEEPSFSAVLAAGKALLVAHFNNSLAALNTPSLREQLLALPAEGLEALLGSDEFGTDNESTVLLLLAVWMWVNYRRTDTESRQRLCRTIRLAHLSWPYLSLILPALAADHEKDLESAAGWFSGVGILEAAFVTYYVSVPTTERQRLLIDGETASAILDLLKLSPRPQCIPPADGLTYSWSIFKADLQKAVGQLLPGRHALVYGTFGHQRQSGVFAWGFQWRVLIRLTGRQSMARVYLQCILPTALAPPGSRLSSECTLTRITTVPISARLVVHRRQGAVQSDLNSGILSDHVKVGAGRGVFNLMPLQEPKGAEGDTVAEKAAADPLAALVDYLTDGKISGTFTLLRPSP